MSLLRKNISTGILYTSITKYSGVLISLLIGAILARLLSPEEFGVVALVAVFTSFFSIVSDFGIGPAIVQNKQLSKEDIQSIFLFSIILGFFLAIVFYSSSYLIASFYNNEDLIEVTRLLSLTVFFSAIRIVPNAILLKTLKFKKIGYITISVQLFSGVLAIFLAYKGFSYFALVYKSIFDGFFTFLLLYWLTPVKLQFKIKLNALKKILRFSTFQFLFNFINYFSRNADNLLIGKYINPAALGFYDKSYQLMTMPVRNLTHVITPVLHPVLSEFEKDKSKIYYTYLKVVEILATIGFPLSIFLFFSSSEIIIIIYGKQWMHSIPVFEMLALTVGIQMILSSSGSIFQALNRTDLLFYSGTLSAVVMVSAICYGIFIGQSIESVGIALIFAFLINFFQGFYFLIVIALDSSYITFLRIFIFPIIISSSVGLGLWLLSKLNFENNYYQLLSKIAISFGVFLALNYINVKNREIILAIIKKMFIKK